MLRVDQRPFKAALKKCLDAYEQHGDLKLFDADFDRVLTQHDHYLNVENVRVFLATLLDAGNVRRARKFVDHIPDSTSSRLVVGVQLVLIMAVAVFVLALVVGLAFFLWQHFFG